MKIPAQYSVADRFRSAVIDIGISATAIRDRQVFIVIEREEDADRMKRRVEATGHILRVSPVIRATAPRTFEVSL